MTIRIRTRFELCGMRKLLKSQSVILVLYLHSVLPTADYAQLKAHCVLLVSPRLIKEESMLTGVKVNCRNRLTMQ